MRILKWLFVMLVLSASGSGVGAQVADECPPSPVTGMTAPYSYYVGVGDARAARLDFTLALSSYDCAIMLAPSYAPAYARRGYAYLQLDNPDRALADYNDALTLDEILVEAYINRGALYTRQGNFGLALADYTLAITLEPDNLAALNNRAVVHAIEGSYDLAIIDLRQALLIAPDDPAAYATLAAVYSALAAENYQQFVAVGGAALPAGTPAEVIAALDDSLRDGNFSVWLALLRQGA